MKIAQTTQLKKKIETLQLMRGPRNFNSYGPHKSLMFNLSIDSSEPKQKIPF